MSALIYNCLPLVGEYECRTLLLVDREVDVGIECNNDHVRENVASTNKQQRLRVVKGDPLGHLHHPKDDNQVGSAKFIISTMAGADRGGWRTSED